MRMLTIPVLVFALVAGLASTAPATAEDRQVTLTGTIKCARCVLNKPDAKACQDVLVAEDGAEYYLVKNAVAEKHGHGCKIEKAAVVTGVVADKDGRKWIEAVKIEEPKKG